ncbi:hypothetical protein [uncultured Pontibacter sp.]|uniref:hypothetical protein n=1 Tax=uncultured Pontibacter sp. TaxID=453356 RepID=UPI002639D2A9|nr:hypothetical protein [uncultured Pontibacter sp.]
MAVLILIAIASAIYFYLKLLSKDSDKLYVSNVSLQRPKGLEFIEPGHNIFFCKPIGKHELHAFTSTRSSDLAKDVYLGKCPNELASRLFEAITRGGVDYGFVHEITNTNRLLIIYQSKARTNTNFWGFLEKQDFEHIEYDFKKEFNLESCTGEDGIKFYKPGIIPKAPEKLEQERQMKDWCTRLEAWWEQKKGGETSEEFDGLLDQGLTVIHASIYKRITGDRAIIRNGQLRVEVASN